MNFYRLLIERLASGKPAALAVILEARGSAPQVPGAAALFSPAGLLHGTVGGGILEAEAEKASRRALRTRRAEVFDFALDAGGVFEEGALCGGEVKVLIDPAPARHVRVWNRMEKARRDRRAGILMTNIIRNDRRGGGPRKKPAVRREWIDVGAASPGWPSGSSAHFRRVVRSSVRDGRPRFVSTAEGGRFLQPFLPAPRLIIAGAGHIGRELCRLGAGLDFEVTVIDDRPEFAALRRLPEADHVLARDIGPAIRDLPLGPDAYLVIVTRGHSRDAEALRASIRRQAAYVGMIGSRRKVGLMRRDFLERGWATAAQWARVRTPIGLPIGSRTVAEIAVSIAAELVKVRSGRGGVIKTTMSLASLSKAASRCRTPKKFQPTVKTGIWAVVLAAGESRRMGRPKPLLPFRGKTVIEHLLETLRSAALDGILVVLGAEADKVAAKIGPPGVAATYNPDFRSGMLSSVKRGFRALPRRARAALVCLVDQPGVSVTTIKALVRAHGAEPGGILLPAHRGRRGHPLLISTKYKAEVLRLDPAVGLRQLLERRAGDVREVPVEDPAVLRDMDTPSEYRREIRKPVASRGSRPGVNKRPLPGANTRRRHPH